MPPGTIDAHVHVGLERYGTIEDYLATMERLGLRQAVLVQYQWNQDNGYLADCRSRFPGHFATIGVVDQAADDAPDRLRRLIEIEGFAGFRARPDHRGLGRKRFATWEVADELGTVASIIGPPELIASRAFHDLVSRFPRIRFRLEHLGGIRASATAVSDPIARAFLALGEAPNTWTMLSGFWLNAGEPPPYSAARPLVAAAVAAFGSDRVCWSGDWNRPGMSDSAYLGEALLEHSFGIDDPAARGAILGGTAAGLFGLE